MFLFLLSWLQLDIMYLLFIILFCGIGSIMLTFNILYVFTIVLSIVYVEGIFIAEHNTRFDINL